MPTSGTTAFSMTAGDIVAAAMEEIGTGIAVTPTANEMTSCIRQLNGLLKSWQTQGLTWKQETISVTTTPATATIALPAYVREVNGGRYVLSATNERQMIRWERDEYNILPNKAAIGTSTCYYVDKGDTGITLYIWPVPSSAATLKLDIDRALDTVTADTETVDIPEELSEALWTNLALRCWTIFFVGNPPPEELVARAGFLYRQALDSYRPAIYSLGAVNA